MSLETVIPIIAAIAYQILQQWLKFNKVTAEQQKQHALLTNHLPHQIEAVRKELVEEINKLPCRAGGNCIEEKK
jgi:hypothetical protein